MRVLKWNLIPCISQVSQKGKIEIQVNWIICRNTYCTCTCTCKEPPPFLFYLITASATLIIYMYTVQVQVLWGQMRRLFIVQKPGRAFTNLHDTWHLLGTKLMFHRTKYMHVHQCVYIEHKWVHYVFAYYATFDLNFDFSSKITKQQILQSNNGQVYYMSSLLKNLEKLCWKSYNVSVF